MAVTQPVLVIGDACVDLIVQLPNLGSDRTDKPDPVLSGGGTGANTAVALARLNVPVALLGAIGDDGYGRFIARDLATEGVDTTHLTIAREASTAVVLAVIDQNGERTVFGWPRHGAAHTAFAPRRVNVKLIRQASWVHTTGICLVEEPVRASVLRGMALARAAAIPVSLDLNVRGGVVDGMLPAEYAAALWDAIALADYVFGSLRDEMTYLAPTASLEETIGLLTSNERIVIARSGAGATIASTDRSTTVPAYRVPVIDTLGAGDVFNAGFIAARLEGKTCAEAARWGNAAAALKIGRRGGRGAPSRAEMEALLDQTTACGSNTPQIYLEEGETV